MDIVYDTQRFLDNKAVRNEGLMVSRLGAAPSSTNVICHVFGPKNDRNGWKYKQHLGPTACVRNEDLYCRV